ncbi:unnamed protein product, partial [Effrenium voratum]
VETLMADVSKMQKDISSVQAGQATVLSSDKLDQFGRKLDGCLTEIMSQLQLPHAAGQRDPTALPVRPLPLGEGLPVLPHASLPRSRSVELIGTGVEDAVRSDVRGPGPFLTDPSAGTRISDILPRSPASDDTCGLEELDTQELSELGSGEVKRQTVLRCLGIGTVEYEDGDGPHEVKPEFSTRSDAKSDNKNGSSAPTPLRLSKVSAASAKAAPVLKTFSQKLAERQRSFLPSTGDENTPGLRFVRTRKRTRVQKLVWSFLEDPDLVRGGRAYVNVLSIAILISSILPIVQVTEPVWLRTSLSWGLFAFDCLFLLEVVMRFYGCPNRLRFFTSFYNLLDILSVLLPMVMKLRLQSFSLATEQHLDLVGVELTLIVMVPVVRLLKLLRRFENSHLIQQAFKEVLGALPSLLYCMMVLVVGFSAIIYVLEPRDNIESMSRAIWFTMVTLTTVGYGDVVPKSPGGNVVVCILMIVSATYMAMPIGIVGKAFGSVWDDRHRLLLMQRLRTRFSTVGYDPQDIPDLFCSYDENGDGELSMDEFRRMLQQLEVEAKEDKAQDVFAAFDNDGSGAIDDSEFIKTLFPTAFKSIYGQEEKDNEENGGNERTEGNEENKEEEDPRCHSTMLEFQESGENPVSV